MVTRTWFRINDFISVNATHNANGAGSGTIVDVTDKTVTTKAQFTDEISVLRFDDMAMLGMPQFRSDFTRHINVTYYHR
jgi:hypothetical protein